MNSSFSPHTRVADQTATNPAESETNESPITRVTVTDLFLRMNSFTSTSTLGIEAFSGPAVLSTQQHPSEADVRHTNATVDATVHPVQATPLPVNIITALSFVIICEPLSLTVLFPFIYFMVRDFGISDDKEVGFYVGFIASSFSLAQFCTSLCWGWISERTGRKPVLLMGLIGNAISLLLFGQAHTLQAAIASRMLCGMLNGNVGICKCIIGEVTDSTNQSEGFSLINIMWSLGTIFGPMIGGLLANPVETYPGLFGSCVFLKENPYFLPCFVSALVSFTGFMVTALLLEETNPNIKLGARGVVAVDDEEQFSQPLNREHCFSAAKLKPKLISAVSTDETVLGSSRGASSSTLAIEDATESTPLLSTARPESRNSALEAASILAIAGYTMLAFQTIILDEVFNLWVVTPREDGGLGYSSADVGISLSLISFIALYFQLRTYPFLVRFRTPLSLFRIGLALYIPPYLMHPIISGIIAPNCSTTFTYACLIINLAFLQFSNILCFTSIFIVINNSVSASNKQQLSTVTGIAQTCAAFVRSIGPALGGVLWAWSITNGMAFPFNYWFVFLAIAGMGVATWIQAQWIPEC
ncbi:major facilitator superfamily domain-containing protein [Chytriomyces cf. hyalinus JEL632]|nr:major facilitator superfamily domain-containing protein [Chytriomyces cf. hyalinus JEL632]